MWRNDMKCKYMFMFPLKNLARKGLKILQLKHQYIDGLLWDCSISIDDTLEVP